MNQKIILIGVILLLVVMVIGSGCAALDPCVRQRDACYEKCPTVVIAKEICQQMCNIEYDRCKEKY
jgi:hypothetical protein